MILSGVNSMRKTLLALGAMTVLLAPNVAMAKEMNGWKVVGSGSYAVGSQKYSFYNTDQQDYLKYDSRTGANLGWDSKPNLAVKFQRQAGLGPIRCGDKLAMYVGKEWFYYGSQTVGINLTSSSALKPEYFQWQFSNCTPGEVIPLNAAVTLKNTVENDSLVGCKRLWGVNLCWADDVFTWRGVNYHKNFIPSWVKAAAIAAGQWIF
jgi:hypothetical protein